MSHIASFRKGWENENLARFILSKISFISNPSTISDDLGSDYFCTLFKVKSKNKIKYLVPNFSFAIQIKSNNNMLNITKKIEYLANLEIPFFVGVINQAELKLTIFSGEYFSQFISLKTPNELLIEFCERNVMEDYFTELKDKKFILKFPKVTEFYANSNLEEINKIVDEIYLVCSLSYKNISSRKNFEYIFYQYGKNQIQINAGKDSIKTFRENFYKRLTENFVNLKWIYERNLKDFDLTEFQVYENLLIQLKKLNLDIPVYVFSSYQNLKDLLSNKKSLSL